MTIRKLVALAGVIALALSVALISTSSATAETTTAPTFKQYTTTCVWQLHGTSDSDAPFDEPQTLIGCDVQVPDTCGVIFQVDTYTIRNESDQKVLDYLKSTGVLLGGGSGAGHDGQIVTSWRFVTAGECAPVTTTAATTTATTTDTTATTTTAATSTTAATTTEDTTTSATTTTPTTTAPVTTTTQSTAETSTTQPTTSSTPTTPATTPVVTKTTQTKTTQTKTRTTAKSTIPVHHTTSAPSTTRSAPAVVVTTPPRSHSAVVVPPVPPKVKPPTYQQAPQIQVTPVGAVEAGGGSTALAHTGVPTGLLVSLGILSLMLGSAFVFAAARKGRHQS